MKKMGVLLLLCMFMMGGCGKVIQNDLSQVRMAESKEILDGQTEQERAQNIKSSIMKMKELEGAAVVVESHTALIGLRVKRTWREDDTRLKNEAGQLAREADASIDGTAITTNDKIIKMIESLERE